jgi:hypothetical protein
LDKAIAEAVFKSRAVTICVDDKSSSVTTAAAIDFISDGNCGFAKLFLTLRRYEFEGVEC